MSAAGLIVVIAPIHILSEANCRDHWAPKARRVAAHRDLASVPASIANSSATSSRSLRPVSHPAAS